MESLGDFPEVALHGDGLHHSLFRSAPVNRAEGVSPFDHASRRAAHAAALACEAETAAAEATRAAIDAEFAAADAIDRERKALQAEAAAYAAWKSAFLHAARVMEEAVASVRH